jgi:hypothetical protein
MGVDRFRVCELYAVAPGAEGSGSGYRLGDRLVLTARHVIVPVLAGAGGRVLVRPVGVPGWLPARLEWEDEGADAALAVIEDRGWRAPAVESMLRWGELAGSDPVPCAAVGFPWASARPDRVRDTAHLYGQLAPLGQLRQGRLDLDVASASPSAREGGSPWAGMSGAAVIADSHLVGVITVDPARYQDRLVAVPIGPLLADKNFRARLAAHEVSFEVAPVGAGWHLRLPGGQAVSLAPPYRPVSRRFGPESSTLLRPEHGLVPFLGRQAVLDQITGWCQDPAGRPVLLVTGGAGSGKTRLGREACVQMLMAGWDAGLADDTRRDGAATDRLTRPTLLVVDDADLRTGLIFALVQYLLWDDAGPPAALLLLARDARAWWDRLDLQQGLASASTILDLDRHPIPLADRAEHLRRASAAFAAYGRPGAEPASPPPTAGLADPAYAGPLLIHIAALLQTVDIPSTPPPGPGQDSAPGDDIIADQPGPPVRQRLLRALCERERTRWYQLGEQAHLSFNPDLPLADQVVALATLTAAADQECATSLLAALPNQAEVTRIGGRSAGGVGTPAVRRARLLESAAARPAHRAAPGRHSAAARPDRRRRPARHGAALGNRGIDPAAGRAVPRRPWPACRPGGPERAGRRSRVLDRQPRRRGERECVERTRRTILPADLVDLPQVWAGRRRRRGRRANGMAAPGRTYRQPPRSGPPAWVASRYHPAAVPPHTEGA